MKTAIRLLPMAFVIWPLVAAVRCYGLLGRHDTFAGRNSIEARRNWVLLTTLVLSVLTPMVLAMGLLFDVLAVVGEDTLNHHLIVAVAAAIFVVIPISAVAGWIGSWLWRTAARRHMTADEIALFVEGKRPRKSKGGRVKVRRH
jgi:hypothetical protein